MPARRVWFFLLMLAVTHPICSSRAFAQVSFAEVVEKANRKVVKIFGSGGYQGLAAYGTGILVSSDGYILTVASHLLDTPDVRVHLFDGRRYQAKVVVVEPQLDAALLKIDKVEDLPFFDVSPAAQEPPAQAGDWILAFTNGFQIATRDEPVSVQRGVIGAFSKLHGRRGIFEAPYAREVYVLDAITNNSGAAGGALTTTRGDLLGIIGKELRNSLTNTWINYAVPIGSLADFVEKARKGVYKPIAKEKAIGSAGVYHGIVLVPNVVDRTPPFVEEVLPNSPAARAGLRPDDLIVYVDGEQVPSVKAFQDFLKKASPGSVVKLEVRRLESAPEGKTDRLFSVDLKLEAQHPSAKKANQK